MTFSGTIQIFVEEKQFLNDKIVVHVSQKYCAIAWGMEEINVCYFECCYGMPCYLEDFNFCEGVTLDNS